MARRRANSSPPWPRPTRSAGVPKQIGRNPLQPGGLLSGLGRREDARREYEEARKLQTALAEAHPAVPLYRSRLANTRNNLGGLLVRMGESRDRVDGSTRRARKLQTALVKAHSDVRSTGPNWLAPNTTWACCFRRWAGERRR